MYFPYRTQFYSVSIVSKSDVINPSCRHWKLRNGFFRNRSISEGKILYWLCAMSVLHIVKDALIEKHIYHMLVDMSMIYSLIKPDAHLLYVNENSHSIHNFITHLFFIHSFYICIFLTLQKKKVFVFSFLYFYDALIKYLFTLLNALFFIWAFDLHMLSCSWI